jgi:hypothetical protein
MFANEEKKIEAVDYIVDITQRKKMFDCLIQWVKVVYEKELLDQKDNYN